MYLFSCPNQFFERSKLTIFAVIDCTKMGVGGKAIPPYIDKIENIQSDAAFILLVEKEAAYMRMAVSDHNDEINVQVLSFQLLLNGTSLSKSKNTGG